MNLFGILYLLKLPDQREHKSIYQYYAFGRTD